MKLDENALVPLGGYESARSWLQMKLQEFARAINRRSIEYEVSASMPTAGAWKKGDFVRNAAPALSGSGVAIGWLRISDGSAHVLNTDWVECITLGGSSLTVQDAGSVQIGSTSATNYGLLVYKNGTEQAVLVRQDGSGVVQEWQTSGAQIARLEKTGDLVTRPAATPPTLTANGEMVFNLTSNTNLRISVRGSDGVTRTANLTLA